MRVGVAGVVMVAWAVLGLATATPYGAHWNHQPSYSSSSQGCATNVHHVTKVLGSTVTETTSSTVTETTTQTLISGTTTTTTSTVSQTTTIISLTTTTETVTSTTATVTSTTTATVTQADCVTVGPSYLLDPRYEESEAGRSSLRLKNHKSSTSDKEGWVWSS